MAKAKSREATAISAKRRRLFVLMATLIGISCGLLAVEITLRFLGLGYGHAPLVSDALLHHAHEQDYVFSSHTPSGEFGGFSVAFDHERLCVDPDRRVLFNENLHQRLIVLMGDSFVEALQVPYSKSLAGRLNAKATADVFFRNCGVSGYSSVLYLIQWRKLLRQQKPAHVFVLLYGNDIHDDEAYAAIANLDADGLPVAVPGPPKDSLRMVFRRSYTIRYLRKTLLALQYHRQAASTSKAPVVGGFVEESPQIQGFTAKCLLQLAREVQSSGTRLTLMSVPSKYESFNPGKMIPGGSFADHVRDWSNENKIDYLDLTPAFRRHAGANTTQAGRLFFEQDIHFTAQGHAEVASALESQYPQYFMH